MNHPLISKFEHKQLNPNIPNVKVGDTVRVVWVISKENNKERLQNFEGVVMTKTGIGIKASVIIRKGTKGNGITRTFPVHSPLLKEIIIKARATKIRRSKIYYIVNLNARALKTKLKNKWL